MTNPVKFVTRTASLLIYLFLFVVGLSWHAASALPLRVAVFYQPGFPYYNMPSTVQSKEIADLLEFANVRADLLNADDLADPTKFNSSTYSALVLPYGNTYPAQAFANIRSFHLAGGCLVLTAIPFTHAVSKSSDGQWRDLGHDPDPALFGNNGIGVGGFAFGPDSPVNVAAGDPIKLANLGVDWGPGNDTQILDISTLPAGDRVVPILTAGDSPVAELVEHAGDPFKGAVDVWTVNPFSGDDVVKSFVDTQLIVRGTIKALEMQGRISSEDLIRAILVLDHAPRPAVYSNLALRAIQRPYPTLQPKSPPIGQRVVVVDGQKLTADERRLVASLQGLVNRTKPRIYVIWDGDDEFWLDQLLADKSVGPIDRVQKPFPALLTEFRSSFRGAVVADPNVYVSPCIAVDIAGEQDLVMATSELAKEYGIPIKVDLRGKFKDDADALRYARRVLLPRSNRYLSLCADPAILGSQIDDIVAAKGTAFWVTGTNAQNFPGADEQKELPELEAMLAKMPLGAIVRGFWWRGDGIGLDEGPGVSLASKFGKITTVSDYVANYSFTSGIRLPSLTQRPQPPAPPLDDTKVYLAITVTDGDNLVTWRDYFRQYFTDPLHGTFPVAYGMGPTLLDLAPNEAQWYYEHAAPTDEFLCDVSGVGYVYPPDWADNLAGRAQALRTFYGWTADYMQRMDMHTVRLMGVSAADIAQVGTDLPAVRFLMPDYGWSGETGYNNITYTLPTGQAVFRSITNSGAGPNDLAAEIRDRIGNVRPAFVNVSVQNWATHLSDMKKMLDLLGPDYVAVTPTQLYSLYQFAKK